MEMDGQQVLILNSKDFITIPFLRILSILEVNFLSLYLVRYSILILYLVYTPIFESSQWKFSTSVSSDSWKDASFSDSSWSTITLGSTTQTTTATQFFRYTFSGVNSLAAYELALKYRYGIAVYINGNQIFLDNLPTSFTSSTQALGSYSSLYYHNFIRNAQEISSSQIVLAIEIHPMSFTTSSSVTFNAWLAVYASSFSNSSIFLILSSSLIDCYNVASYATYIASTSSITTLNDLSVITRWEGSSSTPIKMTFPNKYLFFHLHYSIELLQ